MKKFKQNGFTTPEILLVVLTLVIIGIAGYFVAKHINKSNYPAATTASSTKTNTSNSKSAIPESTYSTTNGVKYLIIKEWNVKLALSASIDNATYTLITNNAYISPAAFLSTSTLNSSQDCVAYYQQGATANDQMPTYQYIQQLALSQKTKPSGTGTNITAQQAANQYPTTYIKVGNYVYTFANGNGQPCSEQAPNILPAFKTAFTTISASK